MSSWQPPGPLTAASEARRLACEAYLAGGPPRPAKRPPLRGTYAPLVGPKHSGPAKGKGGWKPPKRTIEKQRSRTDWKTSGQGRAVSAMDFDNDGVNEVVFSKFDHYGVTPSGRNTCTTIVATLSCED